MKSRFPYLNVLASTLAGDEHTGTLDDEVDVKLLPWQGQGVTAGHNLDWLAVDGDGGVIDDLHIGIEGAECGVVLQQVSGLLDAT